MSATSAGTPAQSEIRPPEAHEPRTDTDTRPSRSWGTPGTRRGFDRRAYAPTQTIVIWGERPDLPEARQKLVPSRLLLALKVVSFFAFMAAIYWGPPYVTCRNMKQAGLFYYGTTVSTCMQERIAARTHPFSDISKHILPRL